MASIRSIQTLAFSKTCDIINALLIILDDEYCIKYFNEYTKTALGWKNKKEILKLPLAKIWKKFHFPFLLNESGQLISHKTMTINGHRIQWQQLQIRKNGKAKSEIFLIGQNINKKDKLYNHLRDLTLELNEEKLEREEIYHTLESVSQEVTGQKLKHRLSPYQYISQVRQYLENVIAKMPCLVYWKDNLLRYLGCNDIALKELGLKSRQEFIGKTDYDFGWDIKMVEKYRKIDEEIIATGKPKLNLEEKIINKKGNEILLLTNKLPLIDSSNKVVGIVGVSVDITKRKYREKKLSLHVKELSSDIDIKKLEQEEIFQALEGFSQEIMGQVIDERLSAHEYISKIRHYFEEIINKMPCYVYWKDTHFRYLGCNDLSLELVNLNSKKEFIGKTDYDFGWETWRVDEIRKLDEEIIKTGRPKLNVEDTVILRNGEELHLLVNKMPLVNEKGEIIGVVGISVDITERKRMEAELKIAKEAAEKSDKAKSEFIENMSHDIKTPLSGVIGMAELLTMNLKNKTYIEYAEDIKNSASQLLDFFNEVLDVINRDTVEKPENGVFYFNKLIKDLVNFINPTIRNKKIQFNWTVDKKINRPFFANRFHIYRVILNLLSNAIKFTANKGKVSLAVKLLKSEVDKQHLEIKVSDTGIGIPKESFEVIFERYTRLTPSHSSQYKGSGLGLYIVKKMIEDMGGSVSVESQVDKGSTFRVVLPLLLASEKPILSPPKFKKSKKPTKLKVKKMIRVLVVEDNPLAMKMVKTLFEAEGCQVDIAETGNKAVELFTHNVYQLVIMDIGLPDIPGYEVTEKFRQYEHEHQQSPTVILGLTAHVQKEELERGVSSGLNKMFSKPITAQLTKEFLDMMNGKDNGVSHLEKNSSRKSKNVSTAISKLPIIDLELGVKILGTNLESAKTMVKALVGMLPGDLQDLKTAFDEKNNQKLKDKAHYIKGGASYCGTPRLKLAATELDHSIKAGADSAVIQKAYQNLCQEIELLIKEYDKLSK